MSESDDDDDDDDDEDEAEDADESADEPRDEPRDSDEYDASLLSDTCSPPLVAAVAAVAVAAA